MKEIRIRAVQRILAKESPEKVIKALGFARACIYNWLDRYRAGVWHALHTGERSGRPKKISGHQIRWIYQTVCDKDPRQLKFSFALWTQSMIVAVIKQEFGIKLSKTPVVRRLHQLGFNCQKPLYLAYQHDSAHVEKWKEKVFPKIQKRSKIEGAVIYFEDKGHGKK